MEQSLFGNEGLHKWQSLYNGSIWRSEEFWTNQRRDGSFDFGLKDSNSLNEDIIPQMNLNDISNRISEGLYEIPTLKEITDHQEQFNKKDGLFVFEHSSMLAKDSEK